MCPSISLAVTGELLTQWYTERACEIEKFSGQVLEITCTSTLKFTVLAVEVNLLLCFVRLTMLLHWCNVELAIVFRYMFAIFNIYFCQCCPLI